VPALRHRSRGGISASRGTWGARPLCRACGVVCVALRTVAKLPRFGVMYRYAEGRSCAPTVCFVIVGVFFASDKGALCLPSPPKTTTTDDQWTTFPPRTHHPPVSLRPSHFTSSAFRRAVRHHAQHRLRSHHKAAREQQYLGSSRSTSPNNSSNSPHSSGCSPCVWSMSRRCAGRLYIARKSRTTSRHFSRHTPSGQAHGQDARA